MEATGGLLPRLVNGFQVAAGLLLVSVTSATVLAEERSNGNLEVLLATPLSTPSIIWGKWRATFRTVPPLCLLPVLVAGTAAVGSGQWIPVVLLTVMILTWGSLLASLGLALASWLPRPGRALAWCVGLYVFISGSGYILLILVFRGRQEVVCSGSPFIAAIILTACCEPAGAGRDDAYALSWNLAWLALYAVMAAALLIWTLRNFSRCVGRMALSRPPLQCPCASAVEEWERALKQEELPEHLTRHLVTMAELHRAGRYDRLADGVERGTGRPAMSVREFVSLHAGRGGRCLAAKISGGGIRGWLPQSRRRASLARNVRYQRSARPRPGCCA